MCFTQHMLSGGLSLTCIWPKQNRLSFETNGGLLKGQNCLTIAAYASHMWEVATFRHDIH